MKSFKDTRRGVFLLDKTEINPFACIASEDIQMLKPHSIWGCPQQSILIMIMYMSHFFLNSFDNTFSYQFWSSWSKNIYVFLRKVSEIFWILCGQTKQIKVFHFFGHCKFHGYLPPRDLMCYQTLLINCNCCFNYPWVSKH